MKKMVCSRDDALALVWTRVDRCGPTRGLDLFDDVIEGDILNTQRHLFVIFAINSKFCKRIK